MHYNTIQGGLNGTGMKIAVVVSRFNELVTEKLLNGCLESLVSMGVLREDIVVVWVPGAFEIPFAASKLVALEQYQAVICLGTVIEGETPHFDYVCGESARGVAHLNRAGKIPVIYGILTTHTTEQALARAGGKSGNKGAYAAQAAVEMANLSQKITATS